MIDDNLEAPLLRSSRIVSTPPRHAFQIRSETDEPQNEVVMLEEIDELPPRPSEVSLLVGNPYSRSFWWQSLPLSIITGAIVAATSFGFCCASVVLSQSAFGADFNLDRGHWRWLYITTAGGFGAGFIRIWTSKEATLVPEPSLSFIDAAGSALASLVALSTGAPLGPEVAVGCLAVLVARMICKLLHIRNEKASVFRLVAVTASTSAFFPTPVLGPLAIQELLAPTKSMETLSLQVIASTTTVLIVRWMMSVVPAIELVSPSTFVMWHVGVAVPIGLACGVLGLAVLLLMVLCQELHYRVSYRLDQVGVPVLLADTIFPTIAGAVNGLLARLSPNCIVNWFTFLQTAVSHNEVHRLSQNVTVWLLLVKVVSIGVSSGFGLVGGIAIPMVAAGAALGLFLAQITGLPVSLTLSCCLAACPTAICPIPLTAVIAVAVMLRMSPEQTVPMLIASVSALSLTSGLGLIRWIGRKTSRSVSFSVHHNGSADQESLLARTRTQESAGDDERPISDDEILSRIRTAIFGGTGS